MGVYIKGMEMPTKVLTVEIHPDGYVCLRNANKVGEAVSVPPHGDLMDKDAAMMRFLDLLKTPGEIYTSDVGEIIANAPTIIPAEEGE